MKIYRSASIENKNRDSFFPQDLLDPQKGMKISFMDVREKFGKDHQHHLRLHCTQCDGSSTCRCSAPKTDIYAICDKCFDQVRGKEEGIDPSDTDMDTKAPKTFRELMRKYQKKEHRHIRMNCVNCLNKTVCKCIWQYPPINVYGLCEKCEKK